MRIIFTFIVTFWITTNNAQSEYLKPYGPQPEVGKPMPDFTLDKITHYKTTKASLKDFQGKWLFLDFWFTGCVVCIKSFPKITLLQKHFGDKAVFLLVGKNDQEYGKGIEGLYEKFRKMQNLQIASAYDSIMSKRWGIHSMPHIIIIDPKGIVRSITDGRDMTKEKIQDLMDDKTVVFFTKDKERPDFDASKLHTSSTNKDENSQLLYTAVLAKWNGEEQSGGFTIEDIVSSTKGFQVSMIPLFGLYDLAYFGTWYWGPNDSLYGNALRDPILEIRDSSLFGFDYGSKGSIKGVYNYNLKIPQEKVTKEIIMRELQHVLRDVFRYEVAIENREMPVWKLIVKSGGKDILKSKGGVPYFGDENGALGSQGYGFSFRNYPSEKNLIFAITHYIDDYGPFIDETGITGNIDLDMENVLMTDINSIKTGLQKNGLDLVKGEKEMKVIVIRDAKPENNN